MVGCKHTSLASQFKHEDLRSWSACFDAQVDKIMQELSGLNVLMFSSRNDFRYSLLLKVLLMVLNTNLSLRPRPYRPLLGVDHYTNLKTHVRVDLLCTSPGEIASCLIPSTIEATLAILYVALIEPL